MADVHSKLDELTELVEDAKSMPMSSSCVLNRTELLGALDEIRQLLPGEIAAASGVLQQRADVVDDGRAEADRIVAGAQRERELLLSREAIAREAQQHAERLLADAQAAASTMRQEVEDYVDGKLANFEVVLSKTMSAVERGRDRLRGRFDDEGLRSADDPGDELRG